MWSVRYTLGPSTSPWGSRKAIRMAAAVPPHAEDKTAEGGAGPPPLYASGFARRKKMRGGVAGCLNAFLGP